MSCAKALPAEGPYPSLEELGALSQELGGEQWRVVSDVAQVVANYLRCHPRVEELRYAGLKSDSLFSQAAQTLASGFGPVVDFRLCGHEGWLRLVCGPCDAKEQVMALEKALLQGV